MLTRDKEYGSGGHEFQADDWLAIAAARRLRRVRKTAPSSCDRRRDAENLHTRVRSNQRKVLLVLTCLGLGVVGIVFVFANAGFWLQAPAQPPSQADAIVVLGGDDGDRSTKALQLYREGYAPLVVLTGLERGDAATPPWLTWRVSFLEARGVPRTAIRFELEARNSYSEAEQLLALMRKEGWHTLIVVSDPPHMRRLAWVWARVFEGSGIDYVLGASAPDWWSPGDWWRDEKSGAFVIMEYIKLAYYRAKR